MPLAAILAVCLLALASGCGEDEDPADSSSLEVDAFDEARAFGHVETQVALGPRPTGSKANRKLVGYLVDSLRQAGAASITVQRPWRNVVATIPGTEPGTIVIGAHHDTKDIPGFVGANDGASGVAVVLELARVFAADAPLDGPSLSIALFDAEEARGDRPFEEDGTRGSLQYIDYAKVAVQNAPRLETIKAMVLFDLVGDCDLQIPREAFSDRRLYDAFADASTEVTGGSAAPFEDEAPGILDDHIPFLEADIPAVDLIDFTFGSSESPGPLWHTTGDTIDTVCPESIDAVGEAAVVAIGQIGR